MLHLADFITLSRKCGYLINRAGLGCIYMERMMYPDHQCIVVLLMLSKEAEKLSSYWVTHFWRVKSVGALRTLQVGAFLTCILVTILIIPRWDKCQKAILHGFNSIQKIFLLINRLVEKKGIALRILSFVHPSHPMAWVADYCTNTGECPFWRKLDCNNLFGLHTVKKLVLSVIDYRHLTSTQFWSLDRLKRF